MPEDKADAPGAREAQQPDAAPGKTDSGAALEEAVRQQTGVEEPEGGAGEDGADAEASQALAKVKGLVAQLKRIDTFRHFSDEVLVNQFLPISRVMTFNPGDIALKEGELDSRVFFLIGGQMKVVKRGVLLSQFNHQGDVFGEVTAIDGSPHSATVVAVKPSICLAIDLGKADKLAPEDRAPFLSVLYRLFAVKLAERLRETGNRVVQLEEALARLRGQD